VYDELTNIKKHPQKDFSMSVTFYAEPSKTVGFDVICVCGNKKGLCEPYNVVSEILFTLRATGERLVGCDEDCEMFDYFSRAITVGPESEELNMANMNARDILEVLAIEADELAGSMNADDFLGRVLIAEAIAPESAEKLVETYSLEDGATIVECGRPAGYVQEKLSALREIAEFAVAHKRKVLWA
jgi:hypothetical protein